MGDQITQAVQNLDAIKSGTDPRERPLAARRESSSEPLTAMRDHVDQCFERNQTLRQHLDREQIVCIVTDWVSRRGRCYYNRTTDRYEYGQRVPSDDLERKQGSHIIAIATDIYENETDWQDTVRHELAHAVCYEQYDEYPASTGDLAAHGPAWRRAAHTLGAEPSACGARDNADRRPYRFACPDGCWSSGKARRSKKVQRPWEKGCGKCGKQCVSYDRGDEPPEAGTCAVESIPWSDRTEWVKSDGL